MFWVVGPCEQYYKRRWHHAKYSKHLCDKRPREVIVARETADVSTAAEARVMQRRFGAAQEALAERDAEIAQLQAQVALLELRRSRPDWSWLSIIRFYSTRFFTQGECEECFTYSCNHVHVQGSQKRCDTPVYDIHGLILHRHV